MRELNPRAWSIDSECWCTRVDYDGYKEEWSGIVPVLAPDNRSKRIGEVEDTNIIVEFPTGLKDKNGQKIYEGDILDDGTHICKIKWSEHFAAFEALNEHEGYKSNAWFEAKYGEVIGNIHETPGLLVEINDVD